MSDLFPLDYKKWTALWWEWRDRYEALTSSLRPTYPWPKRNFMTDEVLVRGRCHGREIELAAVTFGARDPVRYVGVTFADHQRGRYVPSDIGRENLARTFTELEAILAT